MAFVWSAIVVVVLVAAVASQGCDETLRGTKDNGYRGCQNMTIAGNTCQKWTSQSPHSHSRTPDNYPDLGLGDHNYCRNPDGELSIWCYTTSSSVRWEYCEPLWTRCTTNDVCHNLIISQEETETSVFLDCQGQNACRNLTIYASHSPQMHMRCQGDTACLDIVIDAKNTTDFSLECWNETSSQAAMDVAVCRNFEIDVAEADNAVVDALGKRAFVNSSIYAVNATQLSLICWSEDFNGETCWNVDIYLSSRQLSNAITCRFGCERLNFHFQDGLDVGVFTSFTFTECSVCESIDLCIDFWMLYYNAGNESISSVYLGSANNESSTDEALLQFSTYIDGQYACNVQHISGGNAETCFTVSMVIFGASATMIFIGCGFPLKKATVPCRKKRYARYPFTSNKPPLWILLFSKWADLVIYTGILWWFIRIMFLRFASKAYCSSKYYQHAQDKQFCIQDGFCQYKSSLGCVSAEWIKTASELSWLALCLCFVCFGLLLSPCCSYACPCALPDCFLCCKMMSVRKDTQEYRDLVKIYINRRYWIRDNPDKCAICGFLLLYVAEYLAFIPSAVVFMRKPDGTSADNYLIHGYDFYPIVGLILLKAILQLGYTFGPEYKPYSEIKAILEWDFGEGIAQIIMVYLPLFHDESSCSSGTLITKEYMEKRSYADDDEAESTNLLELSTKFS